MKITNSKRRIWQYLQDYRFNSILVKSFGLIWILLTAALAVISFAVSEKMNSIITQEVGNVSVSSLAKTRERIDVVMEEVVQISGQLSLDDDVRAYVLPDTKSLFGRDQVTKVKDKIEMYSGVFNYLDTIYIYSHKSKYVVTNQGGGRLEEFDDTTWFENLTEREYEPARMLSRMKGGTYPPLITYIQPLRLTQMQFLGGIIVNIDMNQLQELIVPNIKNLEESLIIVDNRDNILFSSDKQNLMQKVGKVEFYKDINFKNEEGYQIIHYKGEDLLVSVTSSNRFEWKYISTVPLSAYKDYIDSTKGFYFSLFTGCVLFALVAAFLISLYCYTPVKNIMDLLKDPEVFEENYSGETGLKKDEAHEIALNIVRNLYSNKQMQSEMKYYTNLIDKAQVTALQAQISPHFLYNTLENIRWRAMEVCHGDNEVSQIILNLSEMLRISLESEQQLITMEEEIRNTKIYIEILQLRYEDKLKVIWDIDENALSCLIVKVSLQPVIENSVYHGIKPLRRQGILQIQVRKTGDKVVILVKDNGVGMNPQDEAALNADMDKKYILEEEHIGIRNVNQRLKLLMGEDAGLKIRSIEGTGTTVTFIIPVQRPSDIQEEPK